MTRHSLQHGFSLIELAVVLIVVAFVLGGMLLPLRTQIDARKVEETRAQLATIKQALIGFAQVNGRLPCPTIDGRNGVELPLGVVAGEFGCNAGEALRAHGFLPAATLGLSGAVDDVNDLLLDAWGNPFRYSVSRTIRDEGGVVQDVDGDGNADWYLVVPEGMRIVGLENLSPDLTVCNASAANPPDTGFGAINSGDCRVPADRLTGEAPAVFYSTGPDGAEMVSYTTAQSLYQLENAGERSPLPVTLAGLWVAADRVFVAGPRRGEPDDAAYPYFDDLVEWLSPVVLYERMIAAGRLP